jgi:hypothetical protein
MNVVTQSAKPFRRETIVNVPVATIALAAVLACGLTLALDAAINDRAVPPSKYQPVEPGFGTPQFIPIHTTVKEAKL